MPQISRFTCISGNLGPQAVALNLLSLSHRMRLLAVTFLLLAAPVFAQTVVLPQITFRAANDLTNDTFTFGTGNCNDTVTVRWTGPMGLRSYAIETIYTDV